MIYVPVPNKTRQRKRTFFGVTLVRESSILFAYHRLGVGCNCNNGESARMMLSLSDLSDTLLIFTPPMYS